MFIGLTPRAAATMVDNSDLETMEPLSLSLSLRPLDSVAYISHVHLPDPDVKDGGVKGGSLLFRREKLVTTLMSNWQGFFFS